MEKKIYLLVFFVCLLLTGCYEDKGNYDYKGLPDLKIEMFLVYQDSETGEEAMSSLDGSYTTVKAGQTVHVRPTITSDIDIDKLDLTYSWAYQDEVISTEKELIWVTKDVGSGSVVLSIDDKANSTHFVGSFSVQIDDPYDSSGFLVLSEKDGHSDISFLMGSYYSNNKGFDPKISLYHVENNKYLPDNTFKIHQHFRKGDKETQIMAVAQNDLVDINAYTFREEVRGKDMFRGSIPNPITDVMFMQWVDLVTDAEGRLYRRTKSTNELFHSNQFLEEPLKDADEIVYEGIKFIQGDLSKHFCLLYDSVRKRYLVISDWKNWDGTQQNLGKIVDLPYEGGVWPDGFTPLNNMEGYEVIFTGNYFYPSDSSYPLANKYFSVIKKDDKYYYQYFKVNFDEGNVYVTDCVQGEFLGLSAILNEKSVFALMRYAQGYDSSIHPYLLISSGSSLYLYDITQTSADADSESVKKLFEFDSPIVAMDGQCPNGAHLGVGLESGAFYALNMPYAKKYLMDAEKLIFWSLPAGELGKIKDIRYNIMEQAPAFN